MNRDPHVSRHASPPLQREPALTRNQSAVLAILEEQRSPLSAQGIHTLLRDRQPMGLATVYRALDTLKRRGYIQSRTSLEAEALYSPIHHDHHYLTCLQCGQSVLLDRCPVHDFQAHLESLGSFKIYYHTLEFFGLCEPCIQQDPAMSTSI
jgi:Fur family ferric uptake transcriptional regulator